MKLLNLFLVKTVYYVKRQDFFSNFFKTVLFRAGTGTVTYQKSEPEL